MAPRTFFSTLAPDEFARLLTHVGSPTLVPLVAASSPEGGSEYARDFRGALSPEINKVYFGITCSTRFDFVSENLVLNCEDDINDVRKLLEGCGSELRFTHLIFENLSDIARPSIDQLLDIFRPYIAPSVALHFGLQNKRNGSDIMNTLTSYFNPIFIINPTTNSAITTHANTVRAVNFDGMWLSKYDACWEKIGHSLDEVRICQWQKPWSGVWKECIENINEHCRKLTIINLRNRDGGRLIDDEDFVDFICSYGEQLEHTHLDPILGEDSLAKIVSACENVRCDFRYKNISPDSALIFSALGKNLDKLYLDSPVEIGDTDVDGLKEAMRECDSISVLDVFLVNVPFSRRVISALLPIRMHRLECIKFACLKKHTAQMDSLASIASITTALKSLTIHFCSPISTQSIRAVVSRNPLLQNIEVVENDVQHNAELASTIQPLEDVETHIETFSACPNLGRFFIGFPRKCPVDDHQVIQNMCVVFRNRNMSVRIRFGNGEFDNDADRRRVAFTPAG